MGSFIIEGGHRLQGEVIPQGAKNEALQILCAVMLTTEPVTIHNLPDIVDVNKLINLLGDLGVKTQHLGQGLGALRRTTSTSTTSNRTRSAPKAGRCAGR